MEWEGIGTDCMRMGGCWNVKLHPRSSLQSLAVSAVSCSYTSFSFATYKYHKMPSFVTDTGNGETTVTDWTSITATGSSHESTILSDDTNVSSNVFGDGLSHDRPLFEDAGRYTMKSVIGPLMFMNFAAAGDISGAGYTVDLLFQDHRYSEASLRFFLF